MRHPAYKVIDKAKADLISWAREKGIPVRTIEYVAVFEPWNDRLGVWFYETDADTKRCNAEGTSKLVEERYLAVLKDHGFPFNEFPNVGFVFDSHENVVRNFQGNYFYRLR